MEEEWRMEGGEGGRGEYYTKIVGLRESISSTGAVVKELKKMLFCKINNFHVYSVIMSR